MGAQSIGRDLFSGSLNEYQELKPHDTKIMFSISCGLLFIWSSKPYILCAILQKLHNMLKTY